MALTLALVAAIGVIWFAERSLERLNLAIAGLCFSAAVLLFVVDDFGRAILLSSIVAAAISGASWVKYNYSGLKLIVTDLPLAFAGTVPFLVAQYPIAMAITHKMPISNICPLHHRSRILSRIAS